MNSMETDIKLRGMICRSCVQDVENALLHTDGVLSAKAGYVKASVHVVYDPTLVGMAELEVQLREAGFTPGERTTQEKLTDLFCLFAAVLLTLFLATRQKGGVTAPAGYLGALLLGLITSPHCIGMCGGILLGSVNQKSGKQVYAALAYNLGRLISYTIGGALFGTLGTALGYTQSVKSMILTMLGLAVLVIGLNQWGLLPGLRTLLPESRGACVLPKGLREGTAGRPLLIGLMTALMPCGALYTMWMISASSGSALSGALYMFCFAAGTVPLLGLFGSIGALLPKRWNKLIFKLSAVLVCAMGANLLISGLRFLR